MAIKMKYITDASLDNFLADFNTFPYLDNQSYFTNDGLVFNDIDGRRTLLAKVKVQYTENATTSTEEIKGNLLLK